MRVLASDLRGSENRRVADLLLVDNDPRLGELVAFFLRRSGHDVRLATSFTVAREELSRSRPDLMLSDLDLGEEMSDATESADEDNGDEDESPTENSDEDQEAVSLSRDPSR